MRIVRRDVIVLLMVLNAAFCKAQVDIQVVTVNDTVCAGSNVDFTTQLTSCNGTVNYEWWVNGDSISYGSNSNLTLMAMGNAMTVMVVAHCVDNGLVGLDTSSLLLQVITPILNAGIDQTIDSGNVVTLQASGNVTQVQWYPSFLMNPSDNFEVYCIPTTTTTFMVQGSLDGCIAFDYVTVFLKMCCVSPIRFPQMRMEQMKHGLFPGSRIFQKTR